MTATDNAWRVHDTIVTWTKNVDSKASFALTIESAAAAGLVSLATGGRFAHITGAEHLILWAGVTLLAVALVTVTLVVTPRLGRCHPTDAAGRSFVFFGHLRDWDPDDLRRRLDETDALTELSGQLVRMSQVAWIKHRLLQVSMTTAMAAVAFLALAGLLSSTG
jgi:hypothetical protein